MKQCFYTPFSSTRRQQLVSSCQEYINRGLKAVYILPSREAMFDVRRILMEEHGGIADFLVLGFDDLEKLIVRDVVAEEAVLDSGLARNVIRVLLVAAPPLALAKVADKPGVVDGLFDAIKSLKRQNVDPADFERRIAGLDGLLVEKCGAVSQMYKAYEECKRDNGLLDVNDISRLAVEAARNSDLLKTVGVMVIDGFMNIDPVNISLLQVIAESFPDMDLLAQVPFRNLYNQAFLDEEVLGDLSRLGFDIADDECFNDSDERLTSLAAGVFSGRDLHVDLTGHLEIIAAPCMDYELREIGRKIKELILTENISPADIAVYCRSQEDYADKVRTIFGEMGIPLRMPGGDRFLSIPLVKDLFDLARFLLEGPSVEIFRTAVSSKYLIPIKVTEGLQDGNYRLLKLADRVTATQKPAVYLPAFMKRSGEIAAEAGGEHELAAYLDRLRGWSSADDPAVWLQSYMKLLADLDVIGKLKWMKSQGILTEESFMRDILAWYGYIRIIKDLMAGYSEIPAIQAGEWTKNLIHDLRDRLLVGKSGIRNNSILGVNFLPPDLARGQSYHSVFLVGLNEGGFPAVGGGSALFDIQESAELMKAGVNFRHPLWELQRERIRFNSCLGSAREYICLSYCTADDSETYLIASPFLDEVKSVLGPGFDGVSQKPVTMRQRLDVQRPPASWQEALRHLSGQMWRERSAPDIDMPYLQGIADEMVEAIAYVNHAAGMEISRMDNPKFDKYDGLLSRPELNQSDEGYAFSVSQLNSYAACPFQYYIERVLDLKEEDDDLLGNLKLGTFYHGVLEEYYRDNADPSNYDPDRLRRIFDLRVQELNDGLIQESVFAAVQAEMIKVLQAFLESDADVLARYREQVSGYLQPSLFEQAFELNDRFGAARLKGFIDRVDMERDMNGNLTGRCIIYDYKTSSVKSLKECIEGKDFQLPIYYAAVEELMAADGLQMDCLALIYYSIKKLDRKGIIRKDIKKILFEGNRGPKDVPGPENMKLIMKWVEEQASELVKKIQGGCFTLPPTCPWDSPAIKCPFGMVCRHDRQRLAGKGA